MEQSRRMRAIRPPASTLRRLGGLVLLAGLVVVAIGFVPTHSARAASISGSPFTSQGEYSFVVPTGVTSLHVAAIGGAGGTGGASPCQDNQPSSHGGQGALVTATVAVTPGSTLWVEVGSNGANGADGSTTCVYPSSTPGGAGGTNGGAAGGIGTNVEGGGGGGGGYSALRFCPLSGSGCPSQPWLVVAGGAGGGSATSCNPSIPGGAGGTPNGGGGFGGATGGTQTGPGTGGPAAGGFTAGADGSGTNGGVGDNGGGGGGGGGYFGGGGSGDCGTAAGGSSFGPSNATYTNTSNAPSVDVTYDTTAPTLQLPSPITADATSAAGAVVSYTVTATDPDNSANELTIACSPASGSTLPIGTTTVNCSASDPAGNTSTGSFTVTVQDVSPPTLQLPSPITTTATSAAGAIVTYAVTATDPDNASSELTIACSPNSGSTFPIGTSAVNCTATDPYGNTSTGQFAVVVNDVAPTLHLPSPMTVNATGPSGATVNYSVTASDPIYTASQLPVSCSPASGGMFAIGTATVNCSVIDPAGTIVTGSFQVVVQGAATQVTTQVSVVQGLPIASGLKSSLLTQLQSVQADLQANNTAQACSDLTSYINHVKAQSGKGLTTSQASQLIAAAKQVQAVLGC